MSATDCVPMLFLLSLYADSPLTWTPYCSCLPPIIDRIVISVDSTEIHHACCRRHATKKRRQHGKTRRRMRITGGKTAGNDGQLAAICRKMGAEWVGQEQVHIGSTSVYSSFSVAGNCRIGRTYRRTCVLCLKADAPLVGGTRFSLAD